MSSAPPVPQVEHLPTIFRKIRAGEYRVPPFQREFVWSEKQVIELLESVYKGFPIGSLLFWRVNGSVFNSQHQMYTGFPNVPEKYPASFVLDGVQRLSTLFGVFNADLKGDRRRFGISFDLRNEEFFSASSRRTRDSSIELSAVFNARAFLEEQRRFSEQPDGDLILERSINLLSTFQEYMLPIVTIGNTDPGVVVNIFERINSTGTRLGVVDFMRALTWSDEFDLSTEISVIQNEISEIGFTLEDETILKSLGIVCGLRPLPDVLLRLKSLGAVDLHDAVKRLRATLRKVAQFVSDSTGIANSEALPYEAQWLLLVRLVSDGHSLEGLEAPILAWIQATSFSEALQGRPDHALVRLIDEQVSNIEQRIPLRMPRVEVGIDEFIFKRFLRGKAMTIAYAELLVRRNVFGNGPVRAVPYEDFIPLISSTELADKFARDVSSARTIGNVVYIPSRYRTNGFGVFDLFELADNGEVIEVELLERQFIDASTRRLFRSGRTADALRERARLIISEFT